jgi:hypothetical protein
MYGMVAHVPLRGLIKTQVARMMADLYGPECRMPAQASEAQQNSLLERYLLPIGLKILSRWSTRKERIK